MAIRGDFGAEVTMENDRKSFRKEYVYLLSHLIDPWGVKTLGRGAS